MYHVMFDKLPTLFFPQTFILSTLIMVLYYKELGLGAKSRKRLFIASSQVECLQRIVSYLVRLHPFCLSPVDIDVVFIQVVF